MKLPNIVIATDFAAGGIVTTILNNEEIKWQPRLEGSVTSRGHEHELLKYNIKKNLNLCRPGRWYSTHDENIPLEKFDQRIIITTKSYESRYIIFQRCHKFMNPDWVENTTMESIDKLRELAKEYAIPRITKAREDTVCVELIDLLHERHTLFDTDNPTWLIWKKANNYLYTKNAWLEKRYDEAVWEIENKQYYKYT